MFEGRNKNIKVATKYGKELVIGAFPPKPYQKQANVRNITFKIGSRGN